MFLDQKADGELARRAEPLQGDALARDVVRWLKTQDPKTTYRYLSLTNCLLCRYFRARGFPKIQVGGTAVMPKGWEGPLVVLPDSLRGRGIAVDTYGEALENIEAALA